MRSISASISASIGAADVLLVAVGGAAGSAARYLVGVAALGASAQLPWGTFLVNVAGSFALGVVLGALPPGGVRLLLGTGFCGGFTTFSTFSSEVVALAERGAIARAGAYAAASVALGVAAVVAGAAVGRAVAGRAG
jgi:CrcB protein